ncbi:NfeD family protein [Methylobacterium brachiatum]|jgi:membrane protein implicated in regulation of membrane protease activity|uniref:NfeD family protein n=1 Tax=Methylobacterium brachiatum TaxID=269660 RepID=A0ABV1R4Q6_9HYPH|nr:NfeD family protein [Methylobacterium brachiatum]
MADPLAILAALGPAWSWVIAGLVLAGAEIVVPGVFLIWFGLAAVATGLATALIPIPWQGQTLLFAALAIVLVGLATRLHRRAGRHDATLNRADRGLIGREAVLPEPILQGTGRLRFDDTLWRIEGPDLPAGARVRVIGLAGTVLRVEAV